MTQIKDIIILAPLLVKFLILLSTLSLFYIGWFVAGVLKLQRIYKFGVCGIISAVFDFGALNLTYIALDKNPNWLALAVFAGYLAGAISSYLLVSRTVFKNYKNYSTIFVRFMIIVTVSLGFNEVIVLSLTHFFDLWYNLAKLISVVVVFFWNYFAFKKWVFINESK